MTKKTEVSTQENIEAGNVDQIRDIIFGSQMRDYEKRFCSGQQNLATLLEFFQNCRSAIFGANPSLCR